ncbi:MAG: holo-ACP synthase [Egibacteraceae bacterium]
MSVVGVGVDVVDIARLGTALERTPGLLTRLFTERERTACSSAGGRLRVPGFAARFAAKEAVAKALGTGVRGFSFLDIEVVTEESGRPTVVLHAQAAELAARLGVGCIHVSLSTSADLAVANVVIESVSPGS